MGVTVVVVDSLVFDRGSHPEGGVAALTVVQDLEVFEDGVGNLDAGAPALAVQQLNLEAIPERLDHGVEAVTDRSHGWDEPRLPGTVGERP